MSKHPDPMGDRLKDYERRETSKKFLPYIPVYARIDGRSFSRFTRNANKPFDTSIVNAMRETTRELIKQSDAKIGYVQSDEISLVWETTEPDEQMFFDGKVMKMSSVLAGIATAAFTKALLGDDDWNHRNPNWLELLPHFDARVIQLPNRTEAANMFLWREADARKNAISMIAESRFSHKQLHGKSSKDKIEMINSIADQIPYEDFPVHLRRGTFLRRVVREMPMCEETRLKIPEKKRPESGTLITRSFIEPIDMPQFNFVYNRPEVIFESADPI